jgi:hypothetical protein
MLSLLLLADLAANSEKKPQCFLRCIASLEQESSTNDNVNILLLSLCKACMSENSMEKSLDRAFVPTLEKQAFSSCFNGQQPSQMTGKFKYVKTYNFSNLGMKVLDISAPVVRSC